MRTDLYMKLHTELGRLCVYFGKSDFFTQWSVVFKETFPVYSRRNGLVCNITENFHWYLTDRNIVGVQLISRDLKNKEIFIILGWMTFDLQMIKTNLSKPLICRNVLADAHSRARENNYKCAEFKMAVDMECFCVV